MATELMLLGTAGAPLPVAGRGGISSALVVDGRVFVIDCGRGSPSAFVNAGLDFSRLEAVFLTHFHVDHIGDLPGMLLYPWGVRVGGDGPLPPIRVYGPSRPDTVPTGATGGLLTPRRGRRYAGLREAPDDGKAGMAMAAGSYVQMRASTADRDRSIEVLKSSFVEGRLTRDELDLRLGQAFVSRFFAELMAITADLPVGPFGRLPAHPVTPPFARTRRHGAVTAAAVLVLGGFAALLVLVVAVGAA